MRWKKSILIDMTETLQSKWDDLKINKYINRVFGNTIGNIINLLFSIIWLLYIFIIIFFVQFVESPLRMLTFKGKPKDKIVYWKR